MPATRRSMAPDASPLKSISNNAPPPTLTPGKKVVALKAELEKKDAENLALRNSIDELTSALAGLNVVRDKIDADAAASVAVGAAPKGKGKKDKNAPVPYKTAYKFYCDAHPWREEGINMQKVWKECDPEVRKLYEAMAKADKTRFECENAAYQEEKEALEMYYSKKKQDLAMDLLEKQLAAQAILEKVDAENKKGKKKKAKKDPEAPKRALSSYMCFVADMRELVVKKNPGASPTEVAKILGEMWGKLEKGKGGEKGTKKYDNLAAEDKARYEAEKADYDAMITERNKQAEEEKRERLDKDKEEAMKLLRSRQDATTVAGGNSQAFENVSIENMSVVSELTNGENNNCNKPIKKKQDPNAPKKAKSAYIYFVTENHDEIKASMSEGVTQKDIFTEVGRQWRELKEGGKAKYAKMAEQDKERYAKELKKYNAGKKSEVLNA